MFGLTSSYIYIWSYCKSCSVLLKVIFGLTILKLYLVLLQFLFRHVPVYWWSVNQPQATWKLDLGVLQTFVFILSCHFQACSVSHTLFPFRVFCKLFGSRGRFRTKVLTFHMHSSIDLTHTRRLLCTQCRATSLLFSYANI